MVRLEQHQLMLQAVLALAQRVDPVADRGHALADIEIQSLYKGRVVFQPHTDKTCSGFVANFAQEVEKEQLPLTVKGLSSQGVEQFGRSEALFSSLHHHLSFLDHGHELNPNECVLSGLERFKPQHGSCHPLYASLILLNGVITNDKFCLIRPSQLKLRWYRRPYRSRPRKLAYTPGETSQQGAYHETSVANPSILSGVGRRGKTLGSSLSIAPAMEPTETARRHAPFPPLCSPPNKDKL